MKYTSALVATVQESYDRARAILRSHSTEHKALANALLQYETLDKDDIKAIIEGKPASKQSWWPPAHGENGGMEHHDECVLGCQAGQQCLWEIHACVLLWQHIMGRT